MMNKNNEDTISSFNACTYRIRTTIVSIIFVELYIWSNFASTMGMKICIGGVALLLS